MAREGLLLHGDFHTLNDLGDILHDGLAVGKHCVTDEELHILVDGSRHIEEARYVLLPQSDVLKGLNDETALFLSVDNDFDIDRVPSSLINHLLIHLGTELLNNLRV